MTTGDDRRTLRSRLADAAASARSTARRRATAALSKAPGPVQQTWRLVENTGRGSIEHRVGGLAAEAALFTLISLPALLVAVVGSLGYVAAALGPTGTANLRRLVLEPLQPFLSDTTYAAYQDMVGVVLAQTRGGVVSLSILISIWTGSRAVGRYLETITIAYGFQPRSMWRRRLLAVALTVGGLLGTVAILPPLVAGPRLVHWLAPDAVADTTLRVLNVLFWPAIVIFIVAGLATLYHFGVPWKTPWRRDLPGAVLAMLIWLLASAALRAYLAFLLSNGGLYQRLALPIAVVLWLYITALAVLLGAEFNASIEKLWPHERHPWTRRRFQRFLRRHRESRNAPVAGAARGNDRG